MPVSLFEAEKRGKTGEEDILTSKVFGILSRIDRKNILGQMIEKIGVIISPDEIENADIELWKDYNGTAPDVSIETNSHLIFIECKLGSSISIEQLRREYNEGVKSRKKFNLICLTKDYVEPGEVIELKNEFSCIHWMNWQTINAQLRSVSNISLDKISKELISDLSDLLDSMDLRGFAGFDRKAVQEVWKGTQSMNEYFSEIAIFIGELRGLLETENIEFKSQSGTYNKRDGRGTKLDSPEEWVTSYLTFAFGLKEWPFSSYWNDSYFFVRFYLDSMMPDCKMLIGYTIRTKGNNINQEILFEKRNLICSELKKNNKTLALIEPWSEFNLVTYSGDDLKPDLLSRENLDDYYRTELSHVISLEDLCRKDLIKIIYTNLLELNKMVINIGITPMELTSEITEDIEEEN